MDIISLFTPALFLLQCFLSTPCNYEDPDEFHCFIHFMKCNVLQVDTVRFQLQFISAPYALFFLTHIKIFKGQIFRKHAFSTVGDKLIPLSCVCWRKGGKTLALHNAWMGEKVSLAYTVYSLASNHNLIGFILWFLNAFM